MTKTAIVVAQSSPRLAPLVKQYADVLRSKWQSVIALVRKFIPALLTFAVAYRDAYTEVKDNLGNDAVKALNAGIGLTDTAASRLRDIAEAHGRLSPHAALLPASVDAIHSLAVLATDQPKRFQRELDHGHITPSLTVRDARDLQPRRRKTAAAPAKTWSVVVSFDSRAKAGQSIAQLLLGNHGASVRVSDATLRDEIKAAIGKEHWQEVEPRLSK